MSRQLRELKKDIHFETPSRLPDRNFLFNQRLLQNKRTTFIYETTCISERRAFTRTVFSHLHWITVFFNFLPRSLDLQITLVSILTHRRGPALKIQLKILCVLRSSYSHCTTQRTRDYLHRYYKKLRMNGG